ncbi:uncharacterized protein PgNI_03849 [Pyricularia grisea]|uniref:Uncharacterized protein n=1 Tax=Pyricularia grisea TaxID=148305 RepID=A0A6P8B9U3_PYRGI|nr:uncharacterized protein PgNI_03849 [Pyricularia grisea]TLD12608.1 hypothetical protein PgNI_03849 [Pyricularia grisea]
MAGQHCPPRLTVCRFAFALVLHFIPFLGVVIVAGVAQQGPRKQWGRPIYLGSIISHPLPSHQRGTRPGFWLTFLFRGGDFLTRVLRTQVWYLALVGGFRKEIDTTQRTHLYPRQPYPRVLAPQSVSTAERLWSQMVVLTALVCFVLCLDQSGVAWLSSSNQTFQDNMIYGTQISVTFAFHGNPHTPLPCSVHHSRADDFAIAATRVGMEKKVARPSLFYLVRRSPSPATPPLYVLSLRSRSFGLGAAAVQSRLKLYV